MPDQVTRDNTKPMTDAQLKAVAIANINTTDTSSPTTTYPTEIVQLPSKGKLYPVAVEAIVIVLGVEAASTVKPISVPAINLIEESEPDVASSVNKASLLLVAAVRA